MLGWGSCTDSRAYDHYEPVELDGWGRNDTTRYCVPRQGEGKYAMQLGLRATQAYPYKTVSLIVEWKVIPNKERSASRVAADTVVCRIIDDKGRLSGKSGVSSSELLQHVSSFRLNRGDSLFVTVRHIMSRDLLPGISDVGIQLDRIG